MNWSLHLICMFDSQISFSVLFVWSIFVSKPFELIKCHQLGLKLKFYTFLYFTFSINFCVKPFENVLGNVLKSTYWYALYIGTSSQWAKVRKKSILAGDALFASKAKIKVYLKFFGGSKRIRSEEKISKNVDFSLWGNRATIQTHFGWLHDYLKD